MSTAKSLRSYDPREILADCGAVIDNSHFVFASGRHGAQYVDKTVIFRHQEHMAALCGQLAYAFADTPYDVVVGPESGGVKIAYEVVLYLRRLRGEDFGITAVPATKTTDGGFAFAPGFVSDIHGRRVLIVEDVLTTGGSCRKTVELVRASGGEVVGVGAFVNRGDVTAAELADVPKLVSLVKLDFRAWYEDACPLCALGVPVRKDLGKGSGFVPREERGLSPPYLPLEDMLEAIGGTNGAACKRLLDGNRRLFERIAASNSDHQPWPGGWIDHVVETMNVALVLYRTLCKARSLPFTAKDALLALFLHHLDKVWRYEILEDGRLTLHHSLTTDEQGRHYRKLTLNAFGIQLTPEQCNAVYFARGDWEDFANTNRELGPLAAFCNMCVMASSRIWGAHPLETAEPWTGASRTRWT